MSSDQITCPVCFGYGHKPEPESVMASWMDNDGMSNVIYHDCPRCNGRGQIADPLAWLDEPLTDEERARAGLPLAGE